MELTTVELYTYLVDRWQEGGRLHYYNGSTWDIELNGKRYNLDNNTKTLTITEGAEAEQYFKSSSNIAKEFDSQGRHEEFGQRIQIAMLSTLNMLDGQLNKRDTIPVTQDNF